MHRIFQASFIAVIVASSITFLSAASPVKPNGAIFTEDTTDLVHACGQTIELAGTVEVLVQIVVDQHGGWHRQVLLREDVSGVADPSGDFYTGSILIEETSELMGGDNDDSWPFHHIFRRLVRLTSPTGPTITVEKLYDVTGTPDERILLHRDTKVVRCR